MPGQSARGGIQPDNDLRDFLMVLRRALLMVCKWIEKRYDVPD